MTPRRLNLTPTTSQTESCDRKTISLPYLTKNCSIFGFHCLLSWNPSRSRRKGRKANCWLKRWNGIYDFASWSIFLTSMAKCGRSFSSPRTVQFWLTGTFLDVSMESTCLLTILAGSGDDLSSWVSWMRYLLRLLFFICWCTPSFGTLRLVEYPMSWWFLIKVVWF